MSSSAKECWFLIRITVVLAVLFALTQCARTDKRTPNRGEEPLATFAQEIEALREELRQILAEKAQRKGNSSEPLRERAQRIAAAISEEADTIMDVYEPYLLQLGFLERTPRGRLATQLAYKHLGLSYDKEKPPQPTLWEKM